MRIDRVVAAIPALNAAGTLEPIVRGTLERIADVVVVDDGSTDATGEVAREAGAVVLRHDVNRGKGAALKTAFDWALERGFDSVLTLDADGQHLPGEIPKFLAAAVENPNAVLIIGSRDHLFEGMLRRRRLANQFSARTISFASRTKVSDSQSGFRLYSSDLLRSVTILSDRFDAESEVIVRAGRMGLEIVSIPIGLGFVNGISTSHYRPVVDTARIAVRVIRTMFD